MVVRRRKKSRKYRGERYMRRGYNDRNRGAGNRGGRGKCGWKKKQHKLLKVLREHPEIIERRIGFEPVKRKTYFILNFEDVPELYEKLKEKGFAYEENGVKVLDLSNIRNSKLLSKGTLEGRWKIIVNFASKKAIEKAKSLGSEVIVKW